MLFALCYYYGFRMFIATNSSRARERSLWEFTHGAPQITDTSKERTHARTHAHIHTHRRTKTQRFADEHMPKQKPHTHTRARSRKCALISEKYAQHATASERTPARAIRVQIYGASVGGAGRRPNCRRVCGLCFGGWTCTACSAVTLFMIIMCKLCAAYT